MRGAPLPSGYTWRQQTLHALMKARVNVRIWCEECDHETIHSPDWAANSASLPYDTTLYEIAQRLVCGHCGSRRVGIETVGNLARLVTIPPLACQNR